VENAAEIKYYIRMSTGEIGYVSRLDGILW
jgi:hypothetical protein